MATLLLGAVGTAIGGSIGGTIFGLSGAAIGGIVGSAIGGLVDAAIVQSLTPGQRIESPRLDSLRVTSSTEGAVIPRLFGRMRMGGNLIWATDFTETSTSETQGGKGGGGGVTTTTYYYSCSFAVAICEGPITGIGRIWADGKLMDLTGVTYRVHMGAEDQSPDSLIVAKSGADLAPGYRGTAYVIFENLALEVFGNRIPQLTFEVFASIAEDESSLEALVQAVGLLPGAGEFALATSVVTSTSGSSTAALNAHMVGGVADLEVSLDALEGQVPNAGMVTLPVAWFGDDLRAGSITFKPKVERSSLTTSVAWIVDGLGRGSVGVLSQVSGLPAYGGTPSDASVVQAIQEIKARGKQVTLSPIVLMDIAAGNTLPSPNSDNAATIGQTPYPLAKAITCSPAPGFAGAVDGTSAVGTQVAALFGSAAAGSFSVSGTTVTWTGSGSEWGYRRMILHYAKLAVAAGGVNTFLIGSGLGALTKSRSNTGYPAVAALATLAADVKAIVGSGCAVGYAADWDEYSGHDRGAGTFTFHLDPLWSDSNIAFVGINYRAPLSDWRDGATHLDTVLASSIYDRDYLQGNVLGGEGFDFKYTSSGNRDSQTRTTITDTLGKEWMFRPKDIRGWWSHAHYDRTGGTEAGSPTGWTAQGKPVRLTQIACPAIDRGSNQPSVNRAQKSGSLALPYYSRGYRDDAIQRLYLESVLTVYGATANNPVSGVYGGQMTPMGQAAVWGWDARPNPVFPELSGTWTDSADWETGEWVTGRLGSSGLGSIILTLAKAAGMDASQIDTGTLTGAAEGFVISAIEAPRTSINVLMRYFGFDAVESGGVIRFVQRGRLPSATISADDMVAAEDEVAEPFEQTRQQTTDLPQILKWQVMRSDEEYDPAPVEARRSTAQSRRTLMESFALAVAPEDAKRQADRALFETWVAIEGLGWALPPSYMGLDPCDVIAFVNDGRTTEFRLTTRAEAESLRFEALAQDRFAYDRAPGVSRPASLPVIVTYGPPNAIFMNLPQLTEAAPDYQPYIVADSDPWPGSLVVERSPTTSGYIYMNGVNRRGKLGTLVSDFAAGEPGRWDDASECVIDLDYGTLTSLSDDLILEGGNAFAVETGANQWEIFQAGTVTLVAPGRYSLTHLLRGQKGTEYAIADPAPAGARVVVIDLAVTPVNIAASNVNQAAHWLVGPASKPISDPSFLATTFTPTGAGLRCYSPEPVEDPVGFSPGDFVIEWIRRDRSLEADSWDDGEIPMSEASESYSLEIYDGATLKRTVSTSTPAFTYTSAMQTADLGAPLDVGDTLNIRVYQISAKVGRGIPLIHTINF